MYPAISCHRVHAFVSFSLGAIFLKETVNKVTLVELGTLSMESCVYWLVDGSTWIHEWHLSILRLPSDCQTSQSSACLHRQHPLFYPRVHFASLREPIDPQFHSWREPDGSTSHRTAALRNMFIYLGIWLGVYVHIICTHQKSVPRGYKWNRTDGSLDSAFDWTSCRRIAIFANCEQYLGRKLCVCRGARQWVNCGGHRCTASV